MLSHPKIKLRSDLITDANFVVSLQSPVSHLKVMW